MNTNSTASTGRPVSLSQQMGRWFEQIMGPGYHHYCPTERWSPAINFYEDSQHYSLVVDLAGVATEDVLRLEDGMLVISGIRQTPGLDALAGPIKLHRMEIDHGRFHRAIEVPPDVDASAIQATYRNGYLWIRLPKKNR